MTSREPLLTPAQAGERCRICAKTVLRAIHAGRLRAYRLGEKAATGSRSRTSRRGSSSSVVTPATPAPVSPPSAAPLRADEQPSMGRLTLTPEMGGESPAAGPIAGRSRDHDREARATPPRRDQLRRLARAVARRDGIGAQQVLRPRRRRARLRGQAAAAQALAARWATSTPARRRSRSSSRSGGRSTPARTSSARRCAPTRSFWNSHALPRLGQLQLRELTPQVIARFRAELEADGVGNEAIRKTMTMLQGVMAARGRVGPRADQRGQAHAQAAEAVPARGPGDPAVGDRGHARAAARARPAARRRARGPARPTPACARRRRSRSSGATCARARC